VTFSLFLTSAINIFGTFFGYGSKSWIVRLTLLLKKQNNLGQNDFLFYPFNYFAHNHFAIKMSIKRELCFFHS